jgi:hypothetical protein
MDRGTFQLCKGGFRTPGSTGYSTPADRFFKDPVCSFQPDSPTHPGDRVNQKTDTNHGEIA